MIMKKLKIYIKPFKKSFTVNEIKLNPLMIFFDRTELENELFELEFQLTGSWSFEGQEKFEKRTNKYLANLQSTSGVQFKNRYLKLPKYLERLL